MSVQWGNVQGMRGEILATMAAALLTACGSLEAGGGTGSFGRGTADVSEGAYNPAVSPDGNTIAAGLLGKIWLIPAGGGDAEQLSFGYSWDHHPSWSPDGKRLAYVRDTPASSEIVLHDFGSGTSRTLYGRSPADVPYMGGRSWGVAYSFGETAFHPTNGRLYFVDFRSGIWSVDPDRSTQPEEFLPGSGRIGRPGITERSTFAFSPDGRSVAVERDTTDLWTDLHVAPMAEPLRQLTATDAIKRTEVGWTYDGESIVYLALDEGREVLVERPANGGDEVGRLDLGPFGARELALDPSADRVLVATPRSLVWVDGSTGVEEVVRFRAQVTVPTRSARHIFITNARLFDALDDKVIEGATVEVRDGVIASVSTDPPTASQARVIDAEGRFLMPGLVDSHSHLWVGFNLSIGNTLLRGVTSLIDPGSHLGETLSLREAIRLGLLGGPHVYTTGPTLDGPDGRPRYLTLANLGDAEEAREVVRELVGLGVDALKIYAFLEPAITSAVIEEGHALGVPVVGDFVSTPWSVALEQGVDGFVHLMEQKWRFVSATEPDPAEGPFAVVAPDSAVMNGFFAEVASRGAMFDPTMMASSRHFDGEAFATALAAARRGEAPADPGDPFGRVTVLADMLQAMHRNGVRWVAGTDVGAGLLLDELEIYEAIGIPNATILQTATVNPARWLGRDDFGAIEPGRRADLILVDGDPLSRIRDLENVDVVIQSGRVIVER